MGHHLFPFGHRPRHADAPLAAEPERQNEPPPAESPSVPEESLALRLYEICVSRGYVDGRDWQDVAQQLGRSKERRRDAA